MPRYNLAVPPSSTVEGKAVLIGLLCTLPTNVDIQTENGEGLAAVYEQKNNTQTSKGKRPYIDDMGTLNAIMEQQAGKLYVYRHADKEDAYRLKDTAMRSDPVVAEEIKALESEGVPYVLEFRPRVDLIHGRGDGALAVWDTEGLAEGTPLYRRASQNQAHLKEIEEGVSEHSNSRCHHSTRTSSAFTNAAIGLNFGKFYFVDEKNDTVSLNLTPDALQLASLVTMRAEVPEIGMLLLAIGAVSACVAVKV